MHSRKLTTRIETHQVAHLSACALTKTTMMLKLRVDLSSFSKMVPSTSANGRTKTGTGVVFRSGRMVRVTRAIGASTRRMDKEHFGMSQEINTRGSGSMIRHTAMEPTPTPMALNTKATGLKIYSMAMVSKSGRMAPNTKVTTC